MQKNTKIVHQNPACAAFNASSTSPTKKIEKKNCSYHSKDSDWWRQRNADSKFCFDRKVTTITNEWFNSSATYIVFSQLGFLLPVGILNLFNLIQ